MIQALQTAHSIWLYVVLIVGGLAIGQMLRGHFKHEPWRPTDHNMSFYFVSAMDLEILLGVLLWVTQERWNMVDMMRSVRHPLLMIAAWVAIRWGWYRMQGAPTDELRFARGAIFFALSGVVIMSGVFQILGVF